MASKTQKALERAKRASLKLREYKGGETARAGFNSAMVVSGAMGSGALLGAAGESIAGIPLDAAAGLVLSTAGIALGSPALIYAGAGAAASYMQAWARAATETMLGGSEAIT